MVNKGRLQGLLAVAATSLLWGTTGTAATFAPDVGPLTIGAAALGIGGLLQAVIALPALRSALTTLRSQWSSVGIGSIAVAIYPLAFYSSMHISGVAVGSVISLASAPLVSGLLERIVDKRPLTVRWMLAAALGIVGSAFLCLSKVTANTNSIVAIIAGAFLGLLAGLTYATYSWEARRLMEHGINRSASMGAIFGCGGILLIPILITTGSPFLRGGHDLAVVTYMALIPMFLGYLLFGYGLTKISVSTATTITLAEPAVATILAVTIVGERTTPLSWIGLGTIATALVILVSAPTDTASIGVSVAGTTVDNQAQPHHRRWNSRNKP